jgi:hypothetical protein
VADRLFVVGDEDGAQVHGASVAGVRAAFPAPAPAPDLVPWPLAVTHL